MQDLTSNAAPHESKRLFISYSHKDSVFAHGIARFLQRRGFSVWIDSNNLKPGDEWARSINEAIDASDLVIGILTADSVRRPQVIRELSRALDKDEGYNGLPVLLCVVGRIHDSWFYDQKSKPCKKVLDYLHKYQYIAFNAHADITASQMDELLSCVTSGELVKRCSIDDESLHDAYYVNPFGMPKKARDLRGTGFYKVYNDDLASSTVYPFALDNQWIPRKIRDNETLRAAFDAKGFADPEISTIVGQAQLNHLKVSLIHARQIIVNNSAILNSKGIRPLYTACSDREDGGSSLKEKDAFVSLLYDGSIVVFLYGSNETSPYVGRLPDYETDRQAIEQWNDLCDKCRIYCIRENWSSAIDQHSIDFVRFCCTISDDVESNIMLARSLGIGEHELQWFLATLKDVSVQGFVRTRLTGTNAYDSMRGLSRSYFYENFIVRNPEGDSKPVLNCLFDSNKPFAHQLKDVVDTFYNSLFTNYFRCCEMTPLDEPPTNSFLNQLFLSHGDQQVSELELEYALSEFLRTRKSPASAFDGAPERDEIRQLLEKAVAVDYWTLDRIRSLRNSPYWLDYIDTKEAVISRIRNWSIDFCDVDSVGQKLFNALANIVKEASNSVPDGEYTEKPLKGAPSSHPALDYTSIRIAVGTSVIDAVIGDGDRRITVHDGTYSPYQNHLLVYYQPGSIDCPCPERFILAPIKVFDGMTDVSSGDQYFTQLIRFFELQGFEEVVV